MIKHPLTLSTAVDVPTMERIRKAAGDKNIARWLRELILQAIGPTQEAPEQETPSKKSPSKKSPSKKSPSKGPRHESEQEATEQTLDEFLQ